MSLEIKIRFDLLDIRIPVQGHISFEEASGSAPTVWNDVQHMLLHQFTVFNKVLATDERIKESSTYEYYRVQNRVVEH